MIPPLNVNYAITVLRNEMHFNNFEIDFRHGYSAVSKGKMP